MSNEEIKERAESAKENLAKAAASAAAAVDDVAEAVKTAADEQLKKLEEVQLSEQRQIRRDKLKMLVDAGRNPYVIETWDVTAHSMDVKENFDALDGEEVSMAGRIMSKRVMGKASFFHIQDTSGSRNMTSAISSVSRDSYSRPRQRRSRYTSRSSSF